MFTGLLLQPLALALAGAVAAAPTSSARCAQLWESAPKELASLEVYVAQDYPEGTNFTEPTAIQGYNTPVPHLPAFCRFGAYIHTSNSSKTQFEVWLPTDTWNGRFAMVGNGGDAGGINYPDMWGPIKNYGFAVASTDAGHNGTSGDGTFALDGAEVIRDFADRAVHLTAVYSKQIVELFYSDKPSTSYFFGCSSGGKQGLKELQLYPDTFDGVLAGCSAQWWSRLNYATTAVNLYVNVLNSTGFLAPADYSLIGKEVLTQCDELDGVKDGIILDPRLCKPDLSSLICAGAKEDGCLVKEQADTMYEIWNNRTRESTGEWLFPGFLPGSEASPTFSVTGVPYGPGPDFYSYQVLNKTEISTFNASRSELEDTLLPIADANNADGINAIDGYIEPFLKRGKLLTYAAGADYLIPSLSPVWYYEHVRESLGYPEDLADSFRLFFVPGMGGGTAAFNFGGPGQRDSSLNGTSVSAVFDVRHDMILALLDWVENDIAPDVLIGSKYVQNDRRLGIEFQRKLCPYPQQGVYLGGDPNSADSFECKY